MLNGKTKETVSRSTLDQVEQHENEVVVMSKSVVTSTPMPSSNPLPTESATTTLAPSPTPDVNTIPKKTDCKQVWAASNLNMRVGNNTTYPVINTIPSGTMVMKTGESSDGKWAYIEYNGMSGFCNSNYISDHEPTPEPEAKEVSTEEELHINEYEEEHEETNIDTSSECIGKFEITYYCPCEACNGGWQDGITESGTYGTPYYTIAVDPSVIPLGTTVVINGNEYLAQDTRVYGNHIDMLVGGHQEALDKGVTYADVYIE